MFNNPDNLFDFEADLDKTNEKMKAQQAPAYQQTAPATIGAMPRMPKMSAPKPNYQTAPRPNNKPKADKANKKSFKGVFTNINPKAIQAALSDTDTVIPNGTYMAQLTNWESFPAKEGASHYLKITYNIIDGEYTGVQQTDFSSLIKKDGELNGFVIQKIKSLLAMNGIELTGENPEVEFENGLNSVLGKQFYINIVWDKYNEKDNLTIKVESMIG